MEIPVEKASTGVVVVSPRGRLDMASAPVLREQLRAQVQSGNTRLVVDLSHVDVIDSAGLSALLSGLKAARLAGGSLHVAHPPKQARVILKLTNLNRVLETVDPVDD